MNFINETTMIDSNRDEYAQLHQRIRELEQRVTEQERTIEHLRTVEEHYRRISTNIPGMVYRYVIHADGHTSCLFIGDGSRDLLELEPDELLADSSLFLNRIHEDYREAYIRSEQEMYARVMPWNWVGLLSLPSGKQTWFHGRSQPDVQPNGDMICDGILIDITERKQAEEEIRRLNAELEQRVEERTLQLEQQATELRQNQTLLKGILDNSSAIIYIKDLDGRYLMVNKRYATLLDMLPHEIVGKDERELLPADTLKLWQAADQEMVRTGQTLEREEVFSLNGTEHSSLTLKFPLCDSHNEIYAIGAIVTDITDLKKAEQEQAILQAQIIDSQQAAIRELSTPLLPISDNIVAITLVGAIDSQRAQDIMETLLEGIAHYRAHIAIMDVTGVRVVDTQVAQALIRTTQAVKLLGAQVVLTGIQPQIAQTLVHLGTDLSGIVTRSTLQSGIAYAMEYST